MRLFVRTSRKVELTAAGRTLLEEAPAALAGLERARERTLRTGAGISVTVRLGYTPMALDTLAAVLASAEQHDPAVTIIASEVFSAQIPGRVLVGDLDVGLALHPPPMPGVRAEILRREPLAALVVEHHRLAAADAISLAELRDETLLAFPRDLAPAYFDRIVEACRRAGFEPRIRAFSDPPITASLARLSQGRAVGLTPASFAHHVAGADGGVVVRDITDTAALAELSLVWSESPSPAVAHLLDSARRCAARAGWGTVPQ